MNVTEQEQRRMYRNCSTEGFTRRTIEDGALPIDATQPLATVADEILAHLRAG